MQRRELPSGATVAVTGGRHAPDAVWHLNVFVPIDLAGQLEFTIETLRCEQTLQESVEQTLVKLIVHSPTVDGLGHQGLQCGPRDLIRRDVLPPLGGDRWVSEQVGGWHSLALPAASSRSLTSNRCFPTCMCELRTRPHITTLTRASGLPHEAQPTLAFAVSSSHVSTVSQADRRSDSPNSYFFDHPRGAYRKRSWMMAWNQASRKYKRARSLGD